MAYIRLALVFLTGAAALWAQSAPAGAQNGTNPPAAVVIPKDKDLTPEEIIKKFSAKETEFYEAWMQYTYHQTAEVRVVSKNGVPKDEIMTTVSDIVFRDDGTREVQIKRRAGGLRSVVYTMNDEAVIDDLQPFALTEKELPLYNLKYEGKQKVDELTCYVFSVTPKSTKGKRLFFEGKIWVDEQDLQVVRTVGRPVPQKKGGEQFPEFETVRQVIDKRYWFPVWTHAESTLRFDSGLSHDTIHIEETITYADYKRFASKATIQFEPAQEKQ